MASLPDVRFGVIDDARRRQRRRRLGAVAFLVALAVLIVVLDEPASERQPAPATPPRHVRFVPAGHVLAREPYMGVSCAVPNSTRCDRIGLAVWLKRPAVDVRARIHGHYFSLERQAWNRKPEFDGYLPHAGLRRVYHVPAHWIGANPSPHPFVRLQIDYGHAALVETHVRVWLMAGWG